MLHLQPLAGADEEAAALWCNVWRQLTEVEKRVCYVSEARGLEPCHSPVANSRTACQEKNLPACASSPSCQSEDTEMHSRRVRLSSVETFIEPHTLLDAGDTGINEPGSLFTRREARASKRTSAIHEIYKMKLSPADKSPAEVL